MKVRAEIISEIEINGDESHDEVHERIIMKLVTDCDNWLQGKDSPEIRISYIMEDDEIEIIRRAEASEIN